MEEYPLPEFLKEKGVSEELYRKWLYRKAASLYLRDKKYYEKRGKSFKWERKDYRKAIHEAVSKSNGVCFYTGNALAWNKILKFDGKRKIENLPTVDHLNGRNLDEKLDFVITSWKVNDMKNDLSLEEFLELCKIIVLREKNIKRGLW